MEQYKQLSFKERLQLCTFLDMKLSKSEIANRLGRHRSTIYREIDRNHEDNGGYFPRQAHIKTQDRKQRKPVKLVVNSSCYKYVMRKLKLGWSPEQIAGRMHFLKLHFKICHETIYQYIYKHGRCNIFYYLPTQRKKRQARRKRNPQHARHNIRSIKMRPEEVENRENFGHWEGDTIRFTNESKQSITTLVERKSRYLLLQKNIQSNATTVMNHIRGVISEFSKKFWKTVTFDQGSEFMNFLAIERNTKCKVYYANARSPWQRGSNENTNKRLRRYLPRNTNIDLIDQNFLTHLAELFNKTPRKCLGYLTPKEVFYSSKELAVALDSRT